MSTALDCSNKDNFVKYINSHKYVYVWIDQYYIKATEYYQQEHNIHPVLVYGYDLNGGIYFCKCFSVSKSIYDAEIDIDELHMAIIEASQIKGCFNQDEFFRLYKVKDNITCSFNLNRFVEEVYSYSVGKGGYKADYYAKDDLQLEIENVYHYWMNNVSAYGVDVTMLLYKAFEGLHIRCFDYRLLHMVCENKQLIYERLQYVEDNFSCSDLYRQLVVQYRSLASDYVKLRLLAMKISMAQKKPFFDIDFNYDQQTKFCSQLKRLYLYEKELLPKILDELHDIQIKNIFSQYNIIKAEKAIERLGVSSKNQGRVNSIVLLSDNKLFNGTLFVDQKEIRVEATSANNFFVVEMDDLLSDCSFVPDDMNVTSLSMYVITEHDNKCKYYSSSNGWAGPNYIDPNNLAKYDTTFWCAREDDTNPYVDVVFDDPVNINAILLEQHFMVKNISKLLVQSLINDEWSDLLYMEALDDVQVIKANFHDVTSHKYRVRVMETKVDECGASKVPIIMLLKLLHL